MPTTFPINRERVLAVAKVQNVDELLAHAEGADASDLHLSVNVPPVLRIDGQLQRMPGAKLEPGDPERMGRDLLGGRWSELVADGQVDFSYTLPRRGRYRINVYRQRGSISIAARVIPRDVPSLAELGLPKIISDLARRPQGLIIVTGPTGSGKSTTLAGMVKQINEERTCHIITLEDPIEYLHSHNRSVVDQREVGNDTLSFAAGLRSALRQDPDVILVGEMRDRETMDIALRAAETGHLVMTTLHTRRAPEVVARLVSSFPGEQQNQVRQQMAETLVGVVAQRLLPRPKGGRVAAVEVLVGTPAARNLIREGKSHQLPSFMQTGTRFGMLTLKDHVSDLFRRQLIEKKSLDEVLEEIEIDARKGNGEQGYGRGPGY